MLDNYDSFTWNLVHLFEERGADVHVFRNDAITVAEAEEIRPDRLVISPGPGRPEDAGVSLELIRALGPHVPTLGVCLGHQLLAVARGGLVEPNPAGKQMGVLPIGFRPEGADDRLLGPLAADATAVSIQWNDDIVVRLPPGAELLAATPDGVPQALRLGDAAWGVQFHPEVDAGVVTAWAEEHGPPTPAQVAALAAIADRAAATGATGRALASGFAVVAAARARMAG